MLSKFKKGDKIRIQIGDSGGRNPFSIEGRFVESSFNEERKQIEIILTDVDLNWEKITPNTRVKFMIDFQDVCDTKFLKADD